MMATARIPPEHPPSWISTFCILANHPTATRISPLTQAFFNPCLPARKEWADLVRCDATPKDRRSVEDVIRRANPWELTSLLGELPAQTLTIGSTCGTSRARVRINNIVGFLHL